LLAQRKALNASHDGFDHGHTAGRIKQLKVEGERGLRQRTVPLGTKRRGRLFQLGGPVRRRLGGGGMMAED
jgi:hypothetical protein